MTDQDPNGTATMDPTKDKEKEKEAKGKQGKPAKAAPKWDDEDFVCFVRTNWGTPGIPADKVDHVDKYRFVGGIARNVTYKDAKTWLHRHTIGGHILDNDATMEDIEEATGHHPDTPENIAAALRQLTPEALLAMLGEQSAEELARNILKRKHAGEN